MYTQSSGKTMQNLQEFLGFINYLKLQMKRMKDFCIKKISKKNDAKKMC
jgi:hypothetical protein